MFTRWFEARAPHDLLTAAAHRLTIKAAVLVGFVLVLTLWLLSGYDVMRRLADVERTTSAIHARYTAGEELLSAIQTAILLGSLYSPGALPDRSLPTITDYRGRLNAARDEAEQALRQYVPVVDSPIERDTFARLQREISEFWIMVGQAAEAGHPGETFHSAMLAKRDLVIQISQEIRALNRSGLEQQRSDVSAIYHRMQRRALTQGGFALLFSVLIALLVTRSATRLEAGIRHQIAKQTQSRRDLQRLSTKLIHAQEEERRTIARELHDELGQALTAIKLELSAAQRKDHGLASVSEALGAARAITDHALHTVRDLSQLLHPAVLDDLGLTIAVDRYLHAFTVRSGVQTELVQERMTGRLAAEVETSAYRIVQEATTNVARHAQATLCRVYLQRLPHSLLVTIEDDGRGFDPAEQEADGAHRGLGLLGIQERAAVLQGTCRIESRHGRGTRISVELPAPSSTAEESAGGSAGESVGESREQPRVA